MKAIPAKSVSNSRFSAYVADLPLLDCEVLFRRYAQHADTVSIARYLSITTGHVDRILGRSAEFTENLTDREVLSAFVGWKSLSKAA